MAGDHVPHHDRHVTLGKRATDDLVVTTVPPMGAPRLRDE